MKVHYTEKEWSSQEFDTWLDARDIVDIPESFVNGTEEQKSAFVEQLKTAIKENLHGQRKVDSIVNIELPIPLHLFEEVASLGHKTQVSLRNRLFTLNDISLLDTLLGKGWDRRIFNKQGDFSFVTPGTVTIWLKERQPLFLNIIWKGSFISFTGVSTSECVLLAG